jgi:hypothetical protein
MSSAQSAHLVLQLAVLSWRVTVTKRTIHQQGKERPAVKETSGPIQALPLMSLH